MTSFAKTDLATHQQHLLEELNYRWSVRDEEKVLDALRNQGEVDALYSLESATVVDEFFCFLRELGLWERLEGISLPDPKRETVPLIRLLLLYFLKILSGIESLHALPELLFSNQALMRLVGFSGHQIEQGLTRRGEHRRKGEKRSLPLCPQVIRNQLVCLSLETVTDFFNQAIGALARYGAYGRKIRGHLDATPLLTTEKAKDAGCITQKKTVRTKSGELRHFEVRVYGWKITTLWDAKSGLPLAAAFGKIDQGDRQFTFEVIQQAIRNLDGSGSKLEEVVFDGGYLDGEDFYELDRMGLTWLTRGRVTLNVVEEAVELAECGAGVAAERSRTVTRGKGKNAIQEELRSRVVGVSDLGCFNTYGPPGQSPSQMNRKDFAPAKINAVVVREWEGKVPEEPEVYLTNGPVKDPLRMADAYDQRSEIENRLHRELKQSYTLNNLLQKSEPGAYVHVFLVLTVYALIRAYRTWVREEEEQATRGRGSSLRSFRAKIQRENRDLVVVFDGAYYGLFEMADLMTVLGNIKLKDRDSGPQSWEDLYQKYAGKSPDPP